MDNENLIQHGSNKQPSEVQLKTSKEMVHGTGPNGANFSIEEVSSYRKVEK